MLCVDVARECCCAAAVFVAACVVACRRGLRSLLRVVMDGRVWVMSNNFEFVVCCLISSTGWVRDFDMYWGRRLAKSVSLDGVSFVFVTF